MKRYTVIYRIETDRGFTYVTQRNVDHIPTLRTVVRIPDGSGRYGRVIAFEKS